VRDRLLGRRRALWCWDVFNEPHEGCVPNVVDDRAKVYGGGGPVRERDGANYVRPSEQRSPWEFECGFAVRVAGPGGEERRPLDRRGFAEISFTNRYPVGEVRYRDAETPLSVVLRAATPFQPLGVQWSSYPGTVLRYAFTNASRALLRVELEGRLSNPVLRGLDARDDVRRRNATFRADGFVGVQADAVRTSTSATARPDVVFDDFEREGWAPWTAEGPAFEGGPYPVDRLADYQKVEGVAGRRWINTHNARIRPHDVVGADALTGELLSPEFTVSRRFVNLLVGGGRRPEDAFVEVVVDGAAVAKATGTDRNALSPVALDVAAYEGRTARLRVVDRAAGGWGHVQLDRIVFSDVPAETTPLERRGDFGSVAMVVCAENARAEADVDVVGAGSDKAHGPLGVDLRGGVVATVEIPPGATVEVACVVAWHFTNVSLPGIPPDRAQRAYAARFPDARAVATEIAQRRADLMEATDAFVDAYYGGTLPQWFLERALISLGALQTNTFHVLADGTVWAWEGIGCCEGTCTHVWHYAQSPGRLFPELERALRERTDFGSAFRDDGFVDFRGGLAGRDATDGQAGVVLRTYREHLTSSNDAFLRRVWPRARKALEFLIAQDARDGEPDGVPVGEQHNTLDAEWFGKIPVLTSLDLAALRAGEEMARAVGDEPFAGRCKAIHARGVASVDRLFDAAKGYYVQEEDPAKKDAIGVGIGCYVDQVMGQWWAHQLGLGRLYDEKRIRAALDALWKFNFAPDVGPVRASVKRLDRRGRPYALPGEAGLVMCTWPYGGRRADWERHWQYFYFQECMTGFEHQAAGHLIWEGSPEEVERGLAIIARSTSATRRGSGTPSTKSSARTTTRGRCPPTARISPPAAFRTTARAGASGSRRASGPRSSRRSSAARRGSASTGRACVEGRSRRRSRYGAGNCA
jgi:non-lysosomal glucosylceramidase